MSRKKRAIDKQRRQSAKAKNKQEKRTYYASPKAGDNWEQKKARKSQSQLNRRVSAGVSTQCPLYEWENPNNELCKGCTLKCSYNRK